MPTLEDALAYAKSGKAIFPCFEVRDDGSCACGDGECDNVGKHPYGSGRKKGVTYTDMRRGCLDASADPEQVRVWWERWPGANIGLATGPINKLFVLDFDGKTGLDNYSVLMNGTKPEDTLSVDTGGGGLQLYFKTDKPFKNATHILGPHSGVDTRGAGGYVIAPPSVHASGKTYAWHTKRKMLPLPAYLEAKIETTEETDYLDREPVNEDDWNRTVEDGQGRDGYLIRMAGSLARSKMPIREMVATLDLLNKKNVRPPKPRKAVIRVAKSACRMEARRRERESNGYRPAEVIKEAEEDGDDFVISSEEFEGRFSGVNTDWLIPGVLPAASCGLLLSPPETFKTMMLVDMMLTVSGSRSLFLDTFPALQNGPCIFVQQEDSFARLWERVAMIMNVEEVRVLPDGLIEIPLPPQYPRILWHVHRELNMKNKYSLRKLDAAIRKHKPLLCAIDPMYALLELKDYGSESAKEMLLFKSMRDYYGLSFLIAHHMKKGDMTAEGEGRARRKGWGSVFLEAWQEFGIELMEQPKEGLIRMERHEKNSPRPPIVNVQFNFDPYNYHVEVEEEIKSRTDDGIERVRELLSTQMIRSQKEIKDKTGIKGSQTIINYLSRLGVSKNERGNYVLPEREQLQIMVERGER